MTRRQELVRGVGALAALAVVVIGVPALLASLVGWPLPRRLPSWEPASRALTAGDVADSTWLKAVAVVVWLAWAQFAAAVATEAVAVARGRLARRTALVAWPMQAMAGRLVASAALVATSLAPRALPPMTSLSSVPIASVAEVERPTAAFSTSVVESRAVGAPPAKTWTVARRDTLWSIAERTLGDGERFREIFDINRGVVQPDGRSLTRPEVVEVGWVLRLPEAAVVTEPTLPTEPYRVAPGDSLWRIAERELGDGERADELFDANRGREQPDGRSLGNPDLIRPGWVLQLPVEQAVSVSGPPMTPDAPSPDAQEVRPFDAASSSAPSDSVAAPTGSVPGSTGAERPPLSVVPESTPTPTTPAAEDHEQDDGFPARPVAAGAITLAGVALTLDRLRRVQQRRRSSGRQIRMPEEALARDELALRAVADGEVAEAVVALQTLVSRTQWEVDVDLRCVRAGASGVVVETTDPTASPTGFVVTGDGLAMTAAIGEEVGDGRAALPTLVTIGSDGSDEVLIELEACPVVAVGGDADAAMAFIRAVATGIATAPWADDVELLVVGFGDELTSLPWVWRGESLMDALGAAERRAAEAEESLAYAEVASSMAGRQAGVLTEAWEPLVVVSAMAPGDEETAALRRLAALVRRCVAVVVPGTLEGVEWCLEVGADGTVEVPPLGRSLRAVGVTEETIREIGALVEVASDHHDVEPLHEDEPVDTEVDAEPPVGGAGVGPAIEVRVLGDLEIGRGEEPLTFDRAKSAEAVVYLAMHQRGSTKDALQYALWPEGDNAEGTWHQTISKARRTMGDDAEGNPHFPPVNHTGGVYRLGEGVSTDYRRFGCLADEARGDESRAAELLRDALTMVRGEPLAGRAVAYAWRSSVGATIEAEVVDASEQLAELCLREGDPRGAEWAARQGLLASPYDERLYRVLMRAADAAGNPAGVRRVLQELTAKLELDVEPLDSLHPATAELFESLTERGRRSAAS